MSTDFVMKPCSLNKIVFVILYSVSGQSGAPVRASRGACLGQSFRPGAEADQCPGPCGDALGAVGASLRPVRREAECPACVWGWPCLVSFSLPDGPWGPCGGRGCSLWRRFEELACFLSPWGPCELRGEANLFSFLSEQHPARVWRSAPTLRPPGPRHVSDLGLREAVPRLGLGGVVTPQVPGVPDGEESALHSASTNPAIALREALLPFTAQPLREAAPCTGGRRRAAFAGPPGLGRGLAHLCELGSGRGCLEHWGQQQPNGKLDVLTSITPFCADGSVWVARPCPPLCPVDCSPPGSSPWTSPGENTGVGGHFLPQGIFPTQELNPGLLHCRQILYYLNHLREDPVRKAESPQEKFFSLPVADAG